MLIPKPTNPEELYKFFILGLPREPIEYIQYMSVFRRKGWNALTESNRDELVLHVTYYSSWKHINPDWILTTLKHYD